VSYGNVTHLIDVSAKLKAQADGTITVPAGWPNPLAVAASAKYGKPLGVSFSAEDKPTQEAIMADPSAQAALVVALLKVLADNGAVRQVTN